MSTVVTLLCGAVLVVFQKNRLRFFEAMGQAFSLLHILVKRLSFATQDFEVAITGIGKSRDGLA